MMPEGVHPRELSFLNATEEFPYTKEVKNYFPNAALLSVFRIIVLEEIHLSNILFS